MTFFLLESTIHSKKYNEKYKKPKIYVRYASTYSHLAGRFIQRIQHRAKHAIIERCCAQKKTNCPTALTAGAV
jgi:hypothetical protein